VARTNGSSGFQTGLADAWSPAVTWADVTTGDFNGDGFTDLVGRVQQTGQWFVALSDGKGHFTTALWDGWSPNIAWADVVVGDFTGDGKDDLAGRDPTTGNWFVDRSSGAAFQPPQLWAAWNPAVTWTSVLVGDFNGDGKRDIAGRIEESGAWFVNVSTGAAFAPQFWDAWAADVPGSVDWADVTAGDFNGDGKTDLAGRLRETGQWFVASYTGAAFATQLWDAWSPDATGTLDWVDVVAGDFTGDGKTDLAGRLRETGQWFVASSTGAAFQTALWTAWAANPAVWRDVQVGDFNGDGKDDLAGRLEASGGWYVNLSAGTTFQAPTLWDAWSPDVAWVDVRHGAFA
jgi:hypothetical protein